MTTADARINELEARVAHQDRLMAELNDVITAQWKKIEAVERQMRRLGEELEGRDSLEAPADQKPPHY